MTELSPYEQDAGSFEHQQLQVNGIEMHCAAAGDGPLVLFCHGFPGLWYSWRHQLRAVADAGFRAMALDMRGYGKSSRPAEFADYHVERQAADLLGVLDALDRQRAVLVGHDFGANLAWSMAVRHPERIAGVAGISVPFGYALGDPDTKPSALYASIAEHHFFHMHYFQQVGPADRELSTDSKLFLTRLFWALSARGNLLDWTNFPAEGTGYLDVLAEPDIPLPWDWMSVADMDYYVGEYERTGVASAFSGGLSSYRVSDINWELEKPYRERDVDVPALFISGSEDPVLKLMANDALAVMRERVHDLRGLHLIEGAGHFVQQERSDAFNDALLAFLQTLD